MRRALAFLVGMLPLDAVGRRAVDETLADWRYEQGAARNPIQLLAAALNGWGAIVGTLCRVTARETVAPRTWRMFGAAMVATLTISVAFVAGAALWHDGQFSASTTTILLPIAIASALPVVLLVPPFDTRRGVPVLGLALMLSSTAAINSGWIVPASLVTFKQTTARTASSQIISSSRSPSGSSSVRSSEEQAMPELLATARSGGFEGLRAAQALSDRLAYVTLAPVALLLGVQSRRFTHRLGWSMGGGAIAIVIAALAAFPAVYAVDGMREIMRSQFYPAEELRFLRLWVSPLFIIGACTILSTSMTSMSRQEARQ